MIESDNSPENATEPEVKPKVRQDALPSAYGKVALKHVREAVHGNGIRRRDISVSQSEGCRLKFSAETCLNIKTRTNEKTVAGKVTGPQVIDNPQDLSNALSAGMREVQTQPDKVQRIKALFTARRDKGLGLQHTRVEIPFLEKEFVAYEPCRICNGQCRTACQTCHGRGQIKCKRCLGEKVELCPVCRGHRDVPGPQGRAERCHHCHGNGRIPCTFCHRSGVIVCSHCQGKKAITCQECHGDGVASHVTSFVVEAEATTHIPLADLPEEIRDTVTKKLSDLTQYCDVRVLSNASAPSSYASSGPSKDGKDSMVLQYDVTLPYARVEFTMKSPDPRERDRIVPGLVFGKAQTVMEMEGFLEPLLSSGIRKLEKAARGTGPVIENLKEAARYRSLRHVIMAAAKMRREKAVAKVLSLTPLGLTESTVDGLIQFARRALKNVTRKQRNLAMGGSLLGVLVLEALYFLTPARATMLTKIPNTSLHLVIDVTIGGGLALMGFVIMKALIRRAHRTVLEAVLPRKK